MADTFKPLKGMKDLIGEKAELFRYIINTCEKVFELYDYRPIYTPILERTDLFLRSIGEYTDIVNKEMYTFEDRGGRSVTLRPEGTAGIVRAYINAIGKELRPVSRIYYHGPMFRYERPQKGRLRQFHQVGVEFFGIRAAYADCEVLTLAKRLIEEFNIKVITKINSIGCNVCRSRYIEYLVKILNDKKDLLCPECKIRLDKNPLRVLDCKNPSCRDITEGIDGTYMRLCDDCKRHFEDLKKLLDDLKIDFQIDGRLVRGLDYYNRTVFELVSTSLGSQDAVLAGGRYDRLVEMLGGPETPAVGFAIGVERLMLLLDAEKKASCNIILIPTKTQFIPHCMKIAENLRNHGIKISTILEEKSLKSKMRQASSLGYRWVLLFGEEEFKNNTLTLRDLDMGTQDTYRVEKLFEKLQKITSNSLE